MKTGPLLALLAAAVALVGGVLYLADPSSGSAASATVVPADADGKTLVPVVPALEGPYPKLVIEEKVHPFGEMFLGQTRSHTFAVRNAGEAPLRFGPPRTTCKCTLGDLKDSELPPGGETEIEMTWEPKSADPEFRQQALVPTNDPETPVLELLVTGRVSRLLELRPNSTIALGNLDGPGPHTASFTVTSAVRDAFAVTGVEVADGITAEVAPLAAGELEEEGWRSGKRVTLTLGDDLPVGSVRESVAVKTDQEAPYDVMTVELSGVRSGPLKFFKTPGIVWHDQALAVDLGTFPAAEGKTASLQLYVAGLEEPFEFTGVESGADYVRVTLRPDPKYTSRGGKQKFFVDFTVPPGTPPVAHMRKGSVPVDVKTNHPSAREIRFHVELIAEP